MSRGTTSRNAPDRKMPIILEWVRGWGPVWRDPGHDHNQNQSWSRKGLDFCGVRGGYGESMNVPSATVAILLMSIEDHT